MACARCGEPVLELKGQQTSYAEYRSAKEGPASPILMSCPRCRQALTTGNVKEIEDQFSDAVAWAEQNLDRLAEITSAATMAGSALRDMSAPADLEGLFGSSPDGGKNEHEY